MRETRRRMSYDINIYVTQLRGNLTQNWMQSLNDYDRMVYELHPDIEIDLNQSGFCPIKVVTPGRWPFSSTKSYISGFEMSVYDFDFEEYFGLQSGDLERKQDQLRGEGYDPELWRKYKLEISISFKPRNQFEAKLAFLSAAILTKELNGACSDPQTGQILMSGDVCSWARKNVALHLQNFKEQNLIVYPFEGWR